MELLSVTMNDGVMPRSEIEGKDNSSEDKSNYKVVLTGDMVYNSMRMWQGANGISPCDGIVSPAYTVLMPKIPISNGYFAAFFKSPNLINEFRKNSQGMTSDTWNLKYPQIETIKVCIPALSEQNRVADMLRTLERRIAKQAQLVDNLKKYKRGVVAAILSHQLKFSDATGSPYPEWTSCTLQDAVDFLDGQRKPLESADRAKRQGQYPYYGCLLYTSDYWGLISSLPEARFLVMIERENCGPDLKNALLNAGIFYCYIDDFYSGNAEDIKLGALFKEMERYIDQTVRLNINEMFSAALKVTRVEMSSSEKKQFIAKYLKTMQMEITDDGEMCIRDRYQLLMDALDEEPAVEITYFKPDERKAGGAYVTVTGAVIKVCLLYTSVRRDREGC